MKLKTLFQEEKTIQPGLSKTPEKRLNQFQCNKFKLNVVN